METVYGMAYFLEDKSGKLTASEFVDIHDRLRYSLRCTANDSTRTAYMIYNTTRSASVTTVPLVVLDFGPNNALGNVTFVPNEPIQMKRYLVKPSTLGSSKIRKFTASNGEEYQWVWRGKGDQEWACTNNSGYLVAYYSLKTPGEPEYPNSSGCMLTVEEEYGHLACEMLASLLIMRHIAEHNL
ncbi:hypothetical protein BD779DRAFT_1612978 [Infundibulicybe gibba]|nr:hypothetical protein BD779DRAFT_1612978 [Infundibulicybe gibba]